MAQLLAKVLTPEGLALLITGGMGVALYLIWRQVYNHIPSQIKELRKELKEEIQLKKGPERQIQDAGLLFFTFKP